MDTIFEKKNVPLAIVIVKMNPNGSFLQARSSAICRSEWLSCIAKCAWDKFPGIVANVTCS